MKSTFQKIARLSGATAALLLGANTVLAQSASFFDNPQTGSVPNAAAQGTLGQNVTNLINYGLGFLGLIAVAFIIYAGVLMVTSSGDEEAVTKGRNIITYAAIGIILILLSYTIVTFVTSALG